MHPSLCNVCLAWNRRTQFIGHNKLRQIFEKLTNLQTDTGISIDRMCYACYWQLQKCFKFADLARKSNGILRDLEKKGLEVTPETFLNLDIKPVEKLSILNVTSISIDSEIAETPCPETNEEESLTNKFLKVEKNRENKSYSNQSSFTIESNLDDHFRSHSDGFASDQSSTKTHDRYINLLTKIHTEQYQCDVCDKSFCNKENLRRHVSTHFEETSSNRLEYYTENSLNTETYFENFIETENPAESWETDELEEDKQELVVEIDENLELISNGIDDEKTNQYACTQCPDYFDNRKDLEKHIDLHEKGFPCTQCSKTFRTREKLLYHTKTHTNSKPFMCEQCPKAFSLKVYLNRHMKIHAVDKPYACADCDRKFAFRNSFVKHTQTHSEKIYTHTCDRCAKAFTDVKSLKCHMVVHSGVKPHLCTVCGRRFIRNFQLKEHMRVHTGEKPFGCGVCGKRFTQASSLNLHKKSHTTLRPFICEVCCKSFNNKYSLHKHLRIHTGERPYQCGVCEQRFTYNSGLHDHMRRFHNKGNLTCESCTKTFTRNSHLQRHLKTHLTE